MMQFDATSTALIVMDYQGSILATLPEPDPVIKRVAEAINATRVAGARVCYVRVGFTLDELDDFPLHSAMGQRMKAVAEKVMADAPTSQVDSRLAPQTDDIVVRKRRVGPFSTTDLDAQLKAAGVKTLVMAGTHTSGCVLTGIREAYDLDYQLFVLSDGCADADDKVHQFLMDSIFPKQATVITLAQYARHLD
ncbi:cysteine hydrolase family protein [Paraburkholderia sediminicola]|uniref:cysteine hydrolase family protein n=1 Tax=Paraburkholderia sediminicola TaxID=458836 RepID=UPI0038B932EA